MAKEEEKQFVKLGAKAESFSCPTTGFNLVKKGEAKELTPTVAASKKVIQALRGGHLVYAKETEVIEEEGGGDAIDAEFLKTKTKATLIPMAIELLDDEDEEDEKDIESMKKEELIDFIIRKNSETEE